MIEWLEVRRIVATETSPSLAFLGENVATDAVGDVVSAVGVLLTGYADAVARAAAAVKESLSLPGRVGKKGSSFVECCFVSRKLPLRRSARS